MSKSVLDSIVFSFFFLVYGSFFQHLRLFCLVPSFNSSWSQIMIQLKAPSSYMFLTAFLIDASVSASSCFDYSRNCDLEFSYALRVLTIMASPRFDRLIFWIYKRRSGSDQIRSDHISCFYFSTFYCESS